MGTRYIPNCKRESSPSLTPSSKPSRPSSNFNPSNISLAASEPSRDRSPGRFPALLLGAVGSPSKETSFRFSILNSRFPVTALRRRVMGAWWPSRSSKPLSARFTGRGKFDSYPLRHFFSLPMILSVLPASCRQSKPSCRRDVGSTLACGSWSRCMIRESLTLFMNRRQGFGEIKIHPERRCGQCRASKFSN